MPSPRASACGPPALPAVLPGRLDHDRPLVARRVSSGSGTTRVNWALAIMGFVVVIRIHLLIPLFVRQIKSPPEHADVAAECARSSDTRSGIRRGGCEALQGHQHQPIRLLPADLLGAPFLFALFQVLDSIPGNPRGAFKSNPELFEIAGAAGSSTRHCPRPSSTRTTCERGGHRHRHGRPHDADHAHLRLDPFFRDHRRKRWRDPSRSSESCSTSCR